MPTQTTNNHNACVPSTCEAVINENERTNEGACLNERGKSFVVMAKREENV